MTSRSVAKCVACVDHWWSVSRSPLLYSEDLYNPSRRV
jgi:hypothetical protein